MDDDTVVAELHAQLQAQVEGLVELEQALAASPEDAELLELKEQLEQGVLHLRDSLRDLQQQQQGQEEDVQQQQQQPPAWLSPGARCMFRHTDAQYHPGVVQAWQPQQQQVALQFSFPRLPYQLQPVQLPLGLVLPSTAGNEPAPALAVGSRVLALLPGEQLWSPAEVIQQQHGLDAARWVVQVVGQQRITTLAAADLVPLEQAAAVAADQLDAAAAEASSGHDSDMSISRSGSGASASCSDSDDDAADDSSHAGLGCVMEHARLAAAAGVSTETIAFAAWERSSRGISSKLMAKMGFKAGSGLGRQGRGIAAPLDIDVQASRKGLGCARPKRSGHRHHHDSSSSAAAAAGGKQKLTGRRRKRAKAAADRRAASAGDRQRQSAMEAATGEVGLFALINTSLGHGSEAAAKLAAAGVSGPGETRQTAGGAALAAAAAAAGGQAPGSSKQKQKQQKPALERAGLALVGSQDAASAAQARIGHLTAMLQRNRGDAGLARQIQAKLTQAQQELAAATAHHSRLHKAAADKAAVTKWAKF